MSERALRMPIEGMTCESCERHVVRALEGAGATEVEADFRRGEALLRASAQVDLAQLVEAVRAAGYGPGPVEAVGSDIDQGELHGAVEDSGAIAAQADLRRGDVRFQAPSTLDTGQLVVGARDAGDGPGSVEALRLPHYAHPRASSGGGEYGLAIVGSGAAAFAAAINAREAGARVVMIERGTLGGTCVNTGCVPSKTLLRAGEVYYQAAHHPFAGVETHAGKVDLAALVAQKDELVRQLRREKYEELIADYGWDLVHGEAEFADAHTIQAGDRRIRADRIIIATGASPAVPPIPGLEATGFLTSTTALDLRRVPESLVVIGSGYIALELGQLFHHLGSRVTLMQRSPRILKDYDPEIAEAVYQVMTEQGIQLVTGARFERVEGHSSEHRVYVEANGKQCVAEGEALVVAAGRRPNTPALRLDRAGVELGERGEILIDEYGRTSNPRIFAAGDVTLGPQFVYVAAYEGALTAENALSGAQRKLDLQVVPSVTFTNPVIATVGLTEAQAWAAGYSVQTSVLPAKAVPREIVNRETHGVFKIVADAATDRILGVHVFAENAGDVIHAGTLAIKFGLTVPDLSETFAPYLTMAEGFKLTAQTFGRDVAKLSCCAS